MKKAESRKQKPETDQNPWAGSIPGTIVADAGDRINRIKESTDIAWLNSVLRQGDNQLTVRKAAERRLRSLQKIAV